MDIRADVVKYKWWIVGGIVFLFVVWYLYQQQQAADGAGASSPYYGPSSACIVAGEQLQATQMAVQSQNTQYQDALQANQENNAAAIQLATIQAQTTDNTNTLAAGVANNQIQYGAQTTQYGDTMAAQIAENTNSTNLQIDQSNNAAQTSQYQILGNTLLGEAQIQGQTADTAINAQASEVANIEGTQYGIAQIQSGTQLGIANIQANAAYNINNINQAYGYMTLRAMNG